MSLGRTLGVALVGLTGHLVEVEAHLASSLPGLTLVGLPDAALSEARDRVRAAVSSSGLTWPSPPDHRQPLAGVAAQGRVGLRPGDRRRDAGRRGGLPGGRRRRPDRAPGRARAGRAGASRARRAAGGGRGGGGRAPPGGGRRRRRGRGRARPRRRGGARGLARRGAACLRRRRRGARGRRRWCAPSRRAGPADAVGDLSDVVGQQVARHALEVAAAGGHHLLMVGPPGTGKTMLAARLPGLLPGPRRRRRGGGHRGPLRRGHVPRVGRSAAAPAVRGPAPHGDPGCGGRRRLGTSRVPAPRRARTAACCSWTRRRSSPPRCCRPCASRWSTGRWCCTARPGPRATRPGSSS